jgi:hypothetical protein
MATARILENRAQLPSFVVVGAPKCGTTSLYHYLRQHPQIYLPARKELHFFSSKEVLQLVGGPGDEVIRLHVCGSFAEYRSFYADVNAQPAVGAISPSYFYFPQTADRIKSLLGRPRIIVMVRDPVEKAYSQYMHLVRDGRETLGFYDALMAERHRARQGWSDFWRYAESSLYTARIRRFMDVLGRDRVKVVVFEEFTQRPNEELRDLLSFLAVDPSFELRHEPPRNRSGVPRSRLVVQLVSKSSPIRLAVRQVLPPRLMALGSRLIRRLNTGKKPPMDERARAYLTNYFRDDVAALETLLGRELPWASSRRVRSDA